jgi:hypothetical protein
LRNGHALVGHPFDIIITKKSHEFGEKLKTKILCILLFCIVINACAPVLPQATADPIVVQPTATREQEPTQSETDYTVQSNNLRVVIDGKVNHVSGAFKGGEYYFTEDTIRSLLGTVDTSSPVKINGNAQYRLSDTAKKMGVSSFTYDKILDAIYIWTSLDETNSDNSSDSDEIARAEQNGFGPVSDDVITFSAFMKILDRMVEICDATKLAEWKTILPDARVSENEMTRTDGFFALIYAAETLGGDYFTYNADWVPLNRQIGEPWDDFRYDESIFPDLYDKVTVLGDEERQRNAAAYFYAIGRVSSFSGKLVFDYDEKTNSIRPGDPFTVREAVLAAERVSDTLPFIQLSDAQAVTYDKTAITDKLLAKANAQPKVTLDNIPYWTGFVYGWAQRDDLFKAFKESDIRNMANWGFNSVRLPMDYRDIFNDNVSQVNLLALRQLDKVISFGMKYNIHVEIQFFYMPGWWTEMSDNYKYTGSLDLFTNPEHQRQAQDMWRLLARRYKDIPNSALSFIPIFEAENWARSTGTDIVKQKKYTSNEIIKVLLGLIDAIRSESPERLISLESNSDRNLNEDPVGKATFDKGVLQNANYAADPYVYWTWNESLTDDRTHSYFMPDWPLTRYYTKVQITGNNYQKKDERNSPLEFNGELVKGTVFNFYLTQVSGSGTFVVTADGKEIFKQDINPKVGEDGCESIKDGVYYYKTEPEFSFVAPYAKSDKMLSFTLDGNAKKLEISFTGEKSGWIKWSEIDVTLPDSYAVDRWWEESYYDAHLNGTEPGAFKRKTSLITIIPLDYDYSNDIANKNPITIHPDVTYTTDKIMERVDKQYISDWVDGRLSLYGSVPLLLRFESARFAGAVGDSTAKYYRDLLSVLQSHHISWYNNDFFVITYGNGGSYAGDDLVQYDQYSALDVKLLKVLQEYQEK